MHKSGSRERSQQPASFYALNSLRNVGSKKVRAAAAEPIGDGERKPADDLPYATWLSDQYVKEIKSRAMVSEGGLLARDRDLPDSIHLTSAPTGRLSSKFGYGLGARRQLYTTGLWRLR